MCTTLIWPKKHMAWPLVTFVMQCCFVGITANFRDCEYHAMPWLQMLKVCSTQSLSKSVQNLRLVTQYMRIAGYISQPLHLQGFRVRICISFNWKTSQSNGMKWYSNVIHSKDVVDSLITFLYKTIQISTKYFKLCCDAPKNSEINAVCRRGRTCPAIQCEIYTWVT